MLSIGQGIRSAEYDPIWRAAIRSASPTQLFDKWRRFEVFAHSRNRVQIDLIVENGASFRRYTNDGGTPTPPENLLICGLIIALLEEIGCSGLRCHMQVEGGTEITIREGGNFTIPDEPHHLQSDFWTIGWQTFSPCSQNARPQTDPPEITLPQSCEAILQETIDRLLRLLVRDVAHHWTVGELAGEAGLSTRSLQRRLSIAGLSFIQLVRLVRIHESCRLLRSSDLPITAIGFCSGFSDSAHFSRDFRASMGMTPSDYRATC